MDAPGWFFPAVDPPALSGATRPPRCLLPLSSRCGQARLAPRSTIGPLCSTDVGVNFQGRRSLPGPLSVILTSFTASLLFATQQHVVHLWTSEREGWVFCLGRPEARCFRIHYLWFTGLVPPSFRRLRLSLPPLWTTRHETPPPACLLPSQVAGHCPTPSMTLAHTGAASGIPPASRIRGESSQWVWKGEGCACDCVTVPAGRGHQS